MASLPDGEKKIEDMFIRFDRIHERDRRTDTAWRLRLRLHSIARQKKSRLDLHLIDETRIHWNYQNVIAAAVAVYRHLPMGWAASTTVLADWIMAVVGLVTSRSTAACAACRLMFNFTESGPEVHVRPWLIEQLISYNIDQTDVFIYTSDSHLAIRTGLRCLATGHQL